MLIASASEFRPSSVSWYRLGWYLTRPFSLPLADCGGHHEQPDHVNNLGRAFGCRLHGLRVADQPEFEWLRQPSS